MPGVCAVHAVMLGGASPLSRCAWSRRTRAAQGRPREGASERKRGTNVRGEGHEPDTRCGTAGTSGHATVKSSIHTRAVLYKSGAYAQKV
jgi:hypothetical protein